MPFRPVLFSNFITSARVTVFNLTEEDMVFLYNVLREAKRPRGLNRRWNAVYWN